MGAVFPMRHLPITKDCMYRASSSETKQRVESKRLTPKERRLLLAGLEVSLLL